MNTFKKLVIAATVAGFVAAPIAAVAAEKPKDPVRTIGCGIWTIVTLPIAILTGKPQKCG